MSEDFPRKIINCEFVFKCPQNWFAMQATESENVRFCGECKKSVYFAESAEQIFEFARDGKCVAVFQDNKNEFQKSSESSINFSERPFPIVTAGIPAMPPAPVPDNFAEKSIIDENSKSRKSLLLPIIFLLLLVLFVAAIVALTVLFLKPR